MIFFFTKEYHETMILVNFYVFTRPDFRQRPNGLSACPLILLFVRPLVCEHSILKIEYNQFEANNGTDGPQGKGLWESGGQRQWWIRTGMAQNAVPVKFFMTGTALRLRLPYVKQWLLGGHRAACENQSQKYTQESKEDACYGHM